MLLIVGHVVVHHSSNSKRSAASQFLFSSTGEVVVGVFFLAQFLRRLEREMGSRKYALWLLWIPTVVTAFEAVVWTTADGDWRHSLLGDNGSSSSSSAGYPYALVGGVLQWQYAYVPRLYPRFLSVAGISVSEKASMYIWGLYLLGSQGWPSIWTSVLGILASTFFFAIPSKYMDIIIPDALIRILPYDSIASLLLLDPPSKIYAPLLMANTTNGNNNNNNHRGGGGGGGMARAMPAARPRPRAAPAPPPPQVAIDQLTAMGFDEARVRQALQQSDNSIERAADRLLTSASG
jgi:hypothetical protein